MAPFFIALAKGAEGRTGHKGGTREPVMAPLPYVIVYAVEPDMVHISGRFTPRQTGLKGRRLKPFAHAPHLSVINRALF